VAIQTNRLAAPVAPSNGAVTAFRPLGLREVRLTDGFWADRLRVNRERSIPHGYAQLQATGTLPNFRLAADLATDGYRALGMMFDGPFPFLDSDVYKWLEATGWELGRTWDDDIGNAADEAIDLVARAQRDDGYLNTFVQVLKGGRTYADLHWGHELYCFGHLIQAAVAWHRALGDDRLLGIATRAASHVDAALGPGGRPGIDGHPGIEMALVELYRVTGEERWLRLASHLLEGRGRGLLGQARFGAAYWQDHAPIRSAPSVAGHAVRQLYLDSGAVDVAVELGDEELLEAVCRRWRDMVATRSYLTGGLGSRHRDEAFGDPYELPPDRAYAETCAAIASVMLSWRLLLATGDPEHADVIERTILNGVLAGVGLDGVSFSYENPLQRRTHRVAEEDGTTERSPWFPCACCPPNLMRTFASWPAYLATTASGGVTIHQYASSEIEAPVGSATLRLSMATDYPWSGRVVVTVDEAPDAPVRVAVRVPEWSISAIASGAGEPPHDVTGRRMAEWTRRWQAGDRIELDLGVVPRVTVPDRRIDAVRGCVAVERGPLVYCIEAADMPPGLELEDVRVGSPQPREVERSDIAPGAIGIRLAATASDEVDAIPYFAWANRRPGAMRVWVPTGDVEVPA
jgi:uncharacterized protein